jgi:hypothetical protein
VRTIEKGFWIALSGMFVAFSVAFTVFQLIQYHLCSIAALGIETAQSCSPSGSRGTVVIGLVCLAISSAVLVVTVLLLRRRSLP